MKVTKFDIEHHRKKFNQQLDSLTNKQRRSTNKYVERQRLQRII